MKLISILKGMISQIYIHINDLKPIMPFKINQDVYENHQSGQVSVVVFFFSFTWLLMKNSGIC